MTLENKQLNITVRYGSVGTNYSDEDGIELAGKRHTKIKGEEEGSAKLC